MQQEPEMVAMNLSSWLQSPWEKESAEHLTSLFWHEATRGAPGNADHKLGLPFMGLWAPNNFE